MQLWKRHRYGTEIKAGWGKKVIAGGIDGNKEKEK